MKRTEGTWQTGMTAALLVTALGCAFRPPAPAPDATPPTASRVRVPNLPASNSDNSERLDRLAAERRGQQTAADYVLGQGDLLSVRAIGLEELTQRVRVEADGTISLPLVGTVPVGGKSVAEAQKDLTRRLGAFMYEPNVILFVEEYRGHQVGVMGAVQRPGVVSLTVGHATVLDALSAAGGMTVDAGERIYLIPGQQRQQTAALVAPAVLTNRTADGAFNGHEPIMLDMKEGQAAQATFYALPVRAGDVIVVPGAGHFILQGWVAKPGNYPVTSGLTLRGAIATGGGFAFAADPNRVRIHRLKENGQNESLDVDYAAITGKGAPDVFIHDGDVVEVHHSPGKLAAYGVYKTAVDVIHVGAGIRVP